MGNNTGYKTKQLKQEVLVNLVRAFLSDQFEQNVDNIETQISALDAHANEVQTVQKLKSIIRAETLAGLGFSAQEDDLQTPLSQYASQALMREKPDQMPLSVSKNVCHACHASRVYVTDLCQSCTAHPCLQACRFGAISKGENRSVIDQDKCKKCNMCVAACPYSAIFKTIVPCENACPVGAISKDEKGVAHIDPEKCISCGKCLNACPFGAISYKSQIIDVLRKIKNNEKVIAMVAPAIIGHLPLTPEQIQDAFKQAGFTMVYEVAQGADVTARTEAKDLKERLKNGADFMTTSCCAAYNELVKRHLPEIKPYVSDTKTPLYYTAEIVKKEHPDAVTVFISPCFAKRREVNDNEKVDYILNIEELAALFTAMNIQAENCSEQEFSYQASKEAREFSLSGGVAQSVIAAWDGDKTQIKPVVINGLTKESVRDLKVYAKTGKCPLGNLIEVMSCQGGCIGGNTGLNALRIALKKVQDYGTQSHSLDQNK